LAAFFPLGAGFFGAAFYFPLGVYFADSYFSSSSFAYISPFSI
jgi:hypothetical protein